MTVATSVQRMRLDQTRRYWDAIVATGPMSGCVELYIPECWEERGLLVPGTQAFVGYYDKFEHLAVDLKRIRPGVSAYVVPNPLDFNLLAVSENRLRKCKSRATDNQAAMLRWAHIDIDAVRHMGIKNASANNDELGRAIDRRDQIIDENKVIRESSIWGRSGNGGWILVRLPDWPNDEAHRKKVARLIDSYSDKYSDDLVHVDVQTKNPARLAPLPGTLKCKGEHWPGRHGQPARPWRYVTLDSDSTLSE
jgi:hypothetical protein